MAAPTIDQPAWPDGKLRGGPPLFWLAADGTLSLVNDTTPLPVTVLTSGGEAVATEAKQDTQITHLAQIETAVEGATPAGSNSIGGTKDNGPHWTSVFGVGGVAFTSADATTAAAVTDAPTSGQKLVITDLVMSSDTALFLLFHEESTAGTVIYKVFLPANGTVQITLRSKIKLPTANKKLMVDASAAGNISVTASYFSEA